jgi:hypothetical protein
MDRERKGRYRIPPQRTIPRLRRMSGFTSCQGRIVISLGFYLGLAALLLLLAGAWLVTPPAIPLINQHADPTPATPLPAQVLSSPGSDLYHAAVTCPYAHSDSKPVSKSEALRLGLVPCPYCIGNSAAHLTATVASKQPHGRRRN